MGSLHLFSDILLLLLPYAYWQLFRRFFVLCLQSLAVSFIFVHRSRMQFVFYLILLLVMI